MNRCGRLCSQSLHWLHSSPAAGAAPAHAPLGWRLALDVMDHASLFLQACLAPLLRPPPPAALQARAAPPLNHLLAAPAHHHHEAAVARVAHAAWQLIARMHEAGEVHVAPGRSVVPLRYACRALHGALEQLLRGAAAEVPPPPGGSAAGQAAGRSAAGARAAPAAGSAGGGSAASGGGGGGSGGGGQSVALSGGGGGGGGGGVDGSGAWRPAAVLRRVRGVLALASRLQPLLGPVPLQRQLQAALFFKGHAGGAACGGAAQEQEGEEEGGASMGAGRAEAAAAAYVHSFASWCVLRPAPWAQRKRGAPSRARCDVESKKSKVPGTA